jgi:hypothetical protein
VIRNLVDRPDQPGDTCTTSLEMNRLSRSGLLSNELDSSNDIFGETPEASPQVRGFRQPLKSTPAPATAKSNADLDSSNNIFVGETPETSPTARTSDGQVGSSRRIPSDPTDSGISDSGTKSKSVTPESRFVTPSTGNRTTPGSRFMTPRSTDKYRSPQVIYESDNSGSEAEEDVSEAVIVEDSDASGYEDENESEDGEGGEGDTEVSGFGKKTAKDRFDESEESMLVIKKKTRALNISSDEDEENSRRIDSTKDLLSEDSDDDQPIIRTNRKGTARTGQANKIISDDDSFEDDASKHNDDSSEDDASDPNDDSSEDEASEHTDDSSEDEASSHILESEDSQPIVRKNRNDKKSVDVGRKRAQIISDDEDDTPPEKKESSDEEICITPPPDHYSDSDSEPSQPVHRLDLDFLVLLSVGVVVMIL